MIIFTQSEFNAWSALYTKYCADNQAARKDYTGKKRAAKLYEIEHNFINDVDRLEAPAHERTIKGFSSKRLYEDTKAAILHDVYTQHSRTLELIKAGADLESDRIYKPGTMDDLRIYEQIDELNRRQDAQELSEQIRELFNRYQDGGITEDEARIAKDYEAIKVEVSVDTEKPIETGNAIKLVKTAYPKEFLMPKDKINNKLFEQELIPLAEITIKNSNKNPNITTAITINYDDLQEVQLLNRPKGIMPYDREVSDAITSLAEAGNNIFTDQMIYRVMTGNPKAKLNAPQQKTLKDSIRVLRGTIIRLRQSQEEADAWKLEAPLVYEGNLLMIENIEIQIKGQTVNGYRLTRSPILYEYAKGKSQIARVPIEVINTDVRKTEGNITLQGYLLRRVMAMKGSNLSNTILLNTVIDKLQIGTDLKNVEQAYKKKSKVVKTIEEIFTNWKQKDFIRDFTQNKKGNSIISYTIRV